MSALCILNISKIYEKSNVNKSANRAFFYIAKSVTPVFLLFVCGCGPGQLYDITQKNHKQPEFTKVYVNNTSPQVFQVEYLTNPIFFKNFLNLIAIKLNFILMFNLGSKILVHNRFDKN